MKRNRSLVLGIVSLSLLVACVLPGGANSVTAEAARLAPAAEAAAISRVASIPETPGHFRLESRNGTKLRLNWDWVAGGVGAIHYELSVAGRTLVLPQYYPGYILDVSTLDLRPGHSYTLGLVAVDETGSRSQTPARLVFETTPPTAPTNLRLVSMRPDFPEYPDIISFSLSSDNAGPIRAYEAILNGKSLGTIPGVDNEFSLFDQIFTGYFSVPRGQASLQLRAYDSSLNPSALSEPLTVTFP